MKPYKVNRLGNTIQSRNKSVSVLDTTTLTETIKLPALRAINKSVKYIILNIDIIISLLPQQKI